MGSVRGGTPFPPGEETNVGVRVRSVERVDPGGSEWRLPHTRTHARKDDNDTACRIGGGGRSLVSSAALRPI